MYFQMFPNYIKLFESANFDGTSQMIKFGFSLHFEQRHSVVLILFILFNHPFCFAVITHSEGEIRI